MSSKKEKVIKLVIIISVALLILLGGLYLFYFKTLKLELVGKKEITIEVNSIYEDNGANLYVNNVKKNELLKLKSDLKEDKIGDYKIIYYYKTKKVVRKIKVVDTTKPVITLNGLSEVNIDLGDTYIEEGYTSIDNYDGNLTSSTKVNNNIDYSKEGNYQITYISVDSSNNKKEIVRKVNIISRITSFSNYESIDNTNRGWGISQSTDGSRNETYVDFLKSNNAYYLGENKKVLYLTFDEGGNPVTYVNEIVDILNSLNVKGTFFFCENYIRNNPELINKIVNSGHVIGNHTVNHQSMSKLVNDYNSFLYQIQDVENTYKQVTGKEMEKLFRYPSGEYSFRTLAILKDLGYKTIFWSINYDDWQGDTTKEYSYNILTSRRHNGAIYLIHAKDKGNYEALNDFIVDSLNNGYTFDLVTNI